MAKIAFKINGNSFKARAVPSTVTRVEELLNELPNGDLLTSSELAKRIRCSREAMKDNGTLRHVLLATFRLRVRYPTRMYVWGNPRTIKELSKHKEVLA